MQPLPRLTAERLAALPAGAKLKFSGRVVKFVGLGEYENEWGIRQTMVDYLEPNGIPGSFEKNIFLSVTTEFLNAVRCENCNKFRHPDDCEVRPVGSYLTTRPASFCTDTACAERYFRKHPDRRK